MNTEFVKSKIKADVGIVNMKKLGFIHNLCHEIEHQVLSALVICSNNSELSEKYTFKINNIKNVLL